MMGSGVSSQLSGTSPFAIHQAESARPKAGTARSQFAADYLLDRLIVIAVAAIDEWPSLQVLGTLHPPGRSGA